MPKKKDAEDETYSPAVVRQRFEAALRGARLAGPQHVRSVTPKRAKPQPKKRKKRQG